MEGFTLRWTLEIVVPDLDAEDDRGLLRQIEEDAAPHDLTMPTKVARWVSGTVSAAEDTIADDLPDGWECRIVENANVVSPRRRKHEHRW